ncbi:hypothetical protein V8C35DRAFT_296153 [Trichoderma chlorosporum]
MLSKNPEALVVVVDFVARGSSLQLWAFATGASAKEKVMGTIGLVTCTGSISRYMKAWLSQKTKGGLACFFFFIIFALFFFFFAIYIFCILGQRGVASSHLRFLSSTAFGRGQGVCMLGRAEGFSYFSIFSPEVLLLALAFFFPFFRVFFFHHLTFAFLFLFFLLCAHLYKPFQRSSEGARLEI